MSNVIMVAVAREFSLTKETLSSVFWLILSCRMQTTLPGRWWNNNSPRDSFSRTVQVCSLV